MLCKILATLCCVIAASYAALSPGQNQYLPPKEGYKYNKPQTSFPLSPSASPSYAVPSVPSTKPSFSRPTSSYGISSSIPQTPSKPSYQPSPPVISSNPQAPPYQPPRGSISSFRPSKKTYDSFQNQTPRPINVPSTPYYQAPKAPSFQTTRPPAPFNQPSFTSPNQQQTPTPPTYQAAKTPGPYLPPKSAPPIGTRPRFDASRPSYNTAPYSTPASDLKPSFSPSAPNRPQLPVPGPSPQPPKPVPPQQFQPSPPTKRPLLPTTPTRPAVRPISPGRESGAPFSEYGPPVISEGSSPGGSRVEQNHDDHHHHMPGMPFDFSYAVADPQFGNDYSHNAVSNGDVTQGEYKIQLPDGRKQIVKYTADWATGFHAQVSYEGELNKKQAGASVQPVFPGGRPVSGGSGSPSETSSVSASRRPGTPIGQSNEYPGRTPAKLNERFPGTTGGNFGSPSSPVGGYPTARPQPGTNRPAGGPRTPIASSGPNTSNRQPPSSVGGYPSGKPIGPAFPTRGYPIDRPNEFRDSFRPSGSGAGTAGPGIPRQPSGSSKAFTPGKPSISSGTSTGSYKPSSPASPPDGPARGYPSTRPSVPFGSSSNHATNGASTPTNSYGGQFPGKPGSNFGTGLGSMSKFGEQGRSYGGGGSTNTFGSQSPNRGYSNDNGPSGFGGYTSKRPSQPFQTPTTVRSSSKPNQGFSGNRVNIPSQKLGSGTQQYDVNGGYKY